jgi:hypothetical protein
MHHLRAAPIAYYLIWLVMAQNGVALELNIAS